MPKNHNWGFNTKDLDKSVTPADDFFHFANGGWIKKVSIPDDKGRWGTFDELRETNTKRLRAILKGLAEKKRPNEEERKIRDLYLSGATTSKRDKERYTALKPYLEKTRDLTREDLPAYIATLNTIGVDPFFAIGFDQDDKNSDKQVLRLHQGGLSMPDREYYLRKDAKSEEVRKKFKKYVQEIFSLAGYGKKAAREAAKTILAIETRLAQKSLPAAETRDPIKNYHKKTVATLHKENTPFPWRDYIAHLRKKPIKDLIVDQPRFIAAVSRAMMQMPLADVRTYLAWHLLHSYAPALSSDFRDAAFRFNGKVLVGLKKQRPLWKQAVGAVDGYMGDAIGKIYIKKYFPKKAERQMHTLVEDIKKSFRDRIHGLDWMDEKTRAKALKKLDTLGTKIGYPEKWRSYKTVRITPDSFAKNIIALSKFHFDYEIARVGGKPDRDEWHMSPATVNAYFTPNFNEIVFPAAILQPPFFDPDRDIGFNYGAIGAVIGHETSHSFDDSGNHFDEKGNMKNWWTKKTREEFNKRTRVLVHQYNKYEPVPGERVNGKLTLGENIADLCGVIVAYYAYQKYLKRNKAEQKTKGGFTPEQRFFLGYALSERSKERPEFITIQVRTDPHSPSEYRVNGVVKNMPEFFTAFDVTPKNDLYLPPNRQADIW